MTDEAQPITTTEFAKKEPQPIVTAGSQPAPVPDDKSQQVNVTALRTFHKGENMTGDMVHPGDKFECSRDRAVQLRANGLIEYGDDSLETQLHGETDAKKLKERTKIDAELRKLPKNARTTPLRNPELKLADAPADPSGK